MDPAVGLVKTYLELCGYFVVAELPVRAPDHEGYHDVTDLDVVGVRFPHAPLHLTERAARPLDLFLGVDPALGTFEAGVDVIIGEVKEGQARLNRALRRQQTVAFALRRVGCCPEPAVEEEANRISREGAGSMAMAGRVPCRVRIVAFAGWGSASDHGVHTVSLGHCARHIAVCLRDGRDVFAGVQFKDPVLGLFALQDKLARQRLPQEQ